MASPPTPAGARASGPSSYNDLGQVLARIATLWYVDGSQSKIEAIKKILANKVPSGGGGELTPTVGGLADQEDGGQPTQISLVSTRFPFHRGAQARSRVRRGATCAVVRSDMVPALERDCTG